MRIDCFHSFRWGQSIERETTVTAVQTLLYPRSAESGAQQKDAERVIEEFT